MEGIFLHRFVIQKISQVRHTYIDLENPSKKGTFTVFILQASKKKEEWITKTSKTLPAYFKKLHIQKIKYVTIAARSG
jgi:hypothetical protein